MAPTRACSYQLILVCLLAWLPCSARSLAIRVSSQVNTRSGLKPPTQIITDPTIARLKIQSERQVFPGDYVVSKEYGVGKYLGVRIISRDLTTQQLQGRRRRDSGESGRGGGDDGLDFETETETVVLVRYQDAVLSIYRDVAQKELWFFRASSVDLESESSGKGTDDGQGEEQGEESLGGSAIDTKGVKLSSVIDTRKWLKTQAKAAQSSTKAALNYCKMMAIRNNIHRTPYLRDSDEYLAFEESFSYEPTLDQATCFRDVARDMTENTRPMDRLVCGDVGFGKTEVAIRAVYRAVLSGRQVALLAPTKILAAQHVKTLQGRMPGVDVRLLLGGGPVKQSRLTKEALASGECKVVVGTQALLSPKIAFNNLGLLIIDEEQRFGVFDKEMLKVHSGNTDVLTLSATPIPRTLQLSLTGLRDMSLMNSPPKSRKSVTTIRGRNDDDKLIASAITTEVQRGGQVFIVCPRIEQVKEEFERLQKLLPNNTFAVAHGKMREKLLPAIESFAAREQEVLLATTVIENGIDLPNVNTILVMHADNFGMGQLYQLRGRVGRSDRQAFAYFLVKNTSVTVEAEARLEYLELFNAPGSGYDLSRKDMEMRGSGTLFGDEQSGTSEVGVDLENNILAATVQRLRQELVLSVPETRLQLCTSLEKVGSALLREPIPSDADLMAVSRWEASLASAVITKWKGADGGKAYLAGLLSVSNSSALLQLGKAWRAKHDNRLPILIDELLQRSYIKMLSRRAGITQITFADDTDTKKKAEAKAAVAISSPLVCKMPGVTLKKWQSFFERAIPRDLLPRVAFSHRHASEQGQEQGQDDKDSMAGEGVGYMTLSPAPAPAAGAGAAGGGSDGAGNASASAHAAAIAAISSELIRCVEPMARAVELALNENLLALKE